MKQSTIILLAILFFVGCSKNNSEDKTRALTVSLNDEDKTKVLTISLKDKGDFETLPADSLFSTVKYIPLETNQEALINTIDKVVINNCIYILDTRQNELFIFDLTGKFLRKLNHTGNGPGEYITIDDFQIENDIIYILDASSHSMLTYNSNLEFIEKIKFSESYCAFEITDRYIYLYAGFQSLSYKNIAVLDRKDNKTINQYKTYPKAQGGISSFNKNFFYKYGKDIYVAFPYEYSIYKIDKNGSRKVLDLDFGNKNMYPKNFRSLSFDDHDKYRKQFNYSQWPVDGLKDIRVTKTHMFFSFNFHCLTYTTLLNKTTSKYLCGYLEKTEKFPLAETEISNWSDQKVVQPITSDIILMIKNGKLGKFLPVELSSITEESNPVLGVYSLRKEIR